MEQLPIFLYAATWATIAFGIGYLFEQAETVVSSDTRAHVSRWLLNLDPAGVVASWPTTFVTIFDRVFGERHISWRCFSRSCVASLASVVIVTLVWGVLRPLQFNEFIQKQGTEQSILLIFMVTVVLNFFPDYLSLLETRYVLHWMNRTHSFGRILAFLAIDFCLTAVIGLSAILGVLNLASHVPITDILSEFFGYGIRLTVSKSYWNPTFGIWFYAAFFTSIWVWLYALSGSVVKLMGYLGFGINRFKLILDVENKPLRSLGFVSIILFTIVYTVLPFLL